MLLVIDIGNSNITLGVYDADRLSVVARIATDTHKTKDQYAVELLDILRLYHVSPEDLDGCAISSVVPVLGNALKKAITHIIGKPPLVVGPGVKTGLNIKIDNPAQLGADLAVGAVAAIEQYPLPCIIFDLGTATTIAVVDQNGNYLGGTISAGVGISLEALTSRTSQLPQISIEAPKNVIGSNTIDAMKSGLVLGCAAMLDGLTARIEAQLGAAASLVATGGLCPEIIRHCQRKIIFNDHLLLQGLKIVYEKNN